MMALRNIIKEGVTYYEIFTNKGVFSERVHFIHQDCEGYLFIGNNAYIKCEKCDECSHISNWHWKRTDTVYNSEKEYLTLKSDNIENSKFLIFEIIAIVGSITNETGIAWLQEFLKNLGEDW